MNAHRINVDIAPHCDISHHDAIKQNVGTVFSGNTEFSISILGLIHISLNKDGGAYGDEDFKEHFLQDGAMIYKRFPHY